MPPFNEKLYKNVLGRSEIYNYCIFTVIHDGIVDRVCCLIKIDYNEISIDDFMRYKTFDIETASDCFNIPDWPKLEDGTYNCKISRSCSNPTTYCVMAQDSVMVITKDNVQKVLNMYKV